MKKIYRSKQNKKLAGICGGLGEILEVDPIIIRLASIFLMFFTGLFPLAIVYMIGWILIPEKSDLQDK